MKHTIEELIKQLEGSEAFRKQEPLYDEIVRNFINKTDMFTAASVEKLQALHLHNENIQAFFQQAISLSNAAIPAEIKHTLIGQLAETLSLFEFKLLLLYLNVHAKIVVNFPEPMRKPLGAAFHDFIRNSMQVTAAEARRQTKGAK